MPELTDAQLAEVKPAAHYRPVKKQITLVGYQTCLYGLPTFAAIFAVAGSILSGNQQAR